MSTLVNLCIPVLRRYDLLRNLLLSLRNSTLIPNTVQIIDNGNNHVLLKGSTVGILDSKLIIYTPYQPMGVAESWNWFIENVSEDRIISNDDVVFAPGSLQHMSETPGGLVSALSHVSAAFSCFLIRDSLVKTIGKFDETISPGYAYFEDCDYEERMYARDLRIVPVDCGVEHHKSATLEVSTSSEMNVHHHRFLVAQENFRKKWGRLPRGMGVQA